MRRPGLRATVVVGYHARMASLMTYPRSPVLGIVLVCALAACFPVIGAAAEHGDEHGSAPAVGTHAEPDHGDHAVQGSDHAMAAGGDHAAALTGRQALDALLAGNRRFVADVVSFAHRGAGRRSEVATGQHPIAAVVCCSDSRVPPEQVFDQGVGDIFVVRTAGNVVDAVALGSIEYACEHLHTSLVLVLGHERCGAVTAAVGEGTPVGQVRAVVDQIRRHLGERNRAPADAVEQAVQLNARGVAQDIAACGPIISGLVRSEDVVVVAARYDLDTGDVTVLP